MTENNEDMPLVPKKKKVVSKKINETKKPPNKSSITSEQIQRLLKEALMKNMEDRVVKNELEIDALIATMEEFLRSFIVIGYNMKNEPLVVTNAKSQLDADALYTSLSRLFFSINNGGGLSWTTKNIQ